MMSIMAHSFPNSRSFASAAVLFFVFMFVASGCSVQYSKPDGSPPPHAVVKVHGTTWRAIAILGKRASFFPGQKMDAHFLLRGGERSVSGSAGCNDFHGVYELRGERLSFGSLGTTRMACSPKIMEQERKFLGALRSTVSYVISGRRLILFDSDGRTVMELIPARR